MPAQAVWQAGEHEAVATHALKQLTSCMNWG
eukprot:COSAG06_NODE_74817_length_138_cov_13.564103_1_plen_30_part_10